MGSFGHKLNVIPDHAEAFADIRVTRVDEFDRIRATIEERIKNRLIPDVYKRQFLERAMHGSLGLSYFYKVDALDLILQRMPATIELALTASLLALLIGIPLGFIAGVRHDTMLGRSIMGFSIAGFSLPAFWVGLCLIKFFAADLHWLPSIGRGETRELFGIQWSILTLDGWRCV